MKRLIKSGTKITSNAGQVKLSANALVSRLIKDKFGISSNRDRSGRNAGWVYYPVDRKASKEEYNEFYDNEFLPFIEIINEEYPDLYIDSKLSHGWGPMLKVYGPDYAWDKATHTATPIR